jgi:hypothetical protein
MITRKGQTSFLALGIFSLLLFYSTSDYLQVDHHPRRHRLLYHHRSINTPANQQNEGPSAHFFICKFFFSLFFFSFCSFFLFLITYLQTFTTTTTSIWTRSLNDNDQDSHASVPNHHKNDDGAHHGTQLSP